MMTFGSWRCYKRSMFSWLRRKNRGPDSGAPAPGITGSEFIECTDAVDQIEFLCDLYKVTGPVTTGGLVEFIRSKSDDWPDSTLFATLDWFGQAAYTSHHSVNSNDLDSLDGHNLAGLDPAAFEDGEHRGYFTTKSELPVRKSNFLKQAATKEFADVCGRLAWNSESAESDFFEMNSDHGVVLDEDAYVQIVPVDHSYEAIVAFPNGYFTSDLSPFENYAVAKFMCEKHGYTFFGIGASYLGFMRDEPLAGDTAMSLAEDIASLYGETGNQDLTRDIRDCMFGQNILMLRYTE